jgi:hypothetical protein
MSALSRVLSEMRAQAQNCIDNNERGMGADLLEWAATLEKYEPLVRAAEALRVTEPVEVPVYLRLRERVVSEALALFEGAP